LLVFFSNTSNPLLTCRDDELAREYSNLRGSYESDWYLPCYVDAQLVGRVIEGLKRDKAPGLDGICAEHVYYAHPVLSAILVVIFNWLLMCGRVPDSFCKTYTVPIPKSSDSVNMLRSAADFRGGVVMPSTVQIILLVS